MNQLGLALKQRGLDAAESRSETWVEFMRRTAVTLCAKNGQVTADDVRAVARFHNWHPESPNAYGAIFRGKRWHCIGRKKSEWPGNHAREIRIWQWR